MGGLENIVRSNIKSEFGPPKEGDKRTIDKFAWLPVKITIYKGELEGREHFNYYWLWLEKYKIDQEYGEYWRKRGDGMWTRGWHTIKMYQ